MIATSRGTVADASTESVVVSISPQEINTRTMFQTPEDAGSTFAKVLVLPKKIPEEMVCKVFQIWKGAGVPLAQMFPNRKDYLKIRLAMTDMGLMGNQLRAERLAKQRDRERVRQRTKTMERNAQRAQSLNAALTIFIDQTQLYPTLVSRSANCVPSWSASSWSADEKLGTCAGC